MRLRRALLYAAHCTGLWKKIRPASLIKSARASARAGRQEPTSRPAKNALNSRRLRRFSATPARRVAKSSSGLPTVGHRACAFRARLRFIRSAFGASQPVPKEVGRRPARLSAWPIPLARPKCAVSQQLFFKPPK